MSQDIKSFMSDLIKKTEYWPMTQDEVKHSILHIIENIELLGLHFKNAYDSMSFIEREYLPEHKKNDNSETLFFGKKMTEAQYSGSINTVKLLLNLQDWIKPNEADVFTVRYLCNQISILESKGAIFLKGQHGPTKNN